MRIFCKRSTVDDFKRGQYLLMVRNDADSTLVYPFYCGQFDGFVTLNKVIWLSNANNWSNNPLDGFSFPLLYLEKNIKDIYSITEKEYNIFKSCKSKKDLVDILPHLKEWVFSGN